MRGGRASATTSSGTLPRPRGREVWAWAPLCTFSRYLQSRRMLLKCTGRGGGPFTPNPKHMFMCFLYEGQLWGASTSTPLSLAQKQSCLSRSGVFRACEPVHLLRDHPQHPLLREPAQEFCATQRTRSVSLHLSAFLICPLLLSVCLCIHPSTHPPTHLFIHPSSTIPIINPYLSIHSPHLSVQTNKEEDTAISFVHTCVHPTGCVSAEPGLTPPP